MFVTSREQKLIATFLKKGKLTIAEMLELTGKSRRTLYRDLDKLQQSLPEGLSLRNSDEGYFLKGNLEVLGQLHELVEYSASERLHGELLLLIENRASIASLTEYFGVSQPTVTHDLRQIDQTLLENNLFLERERGLKIIGPEENIRSILVSCIYEASSIQEMLLGNFSENKILSFLDLEKFGQAYQAFEGINLPEGMTDKVRVLMQLFLTATLLRINDHSVNMDSMRRPSKQALSFVNQLLKNLPESNFVISEITYLAAVYDVLYFGFGREILFMEKFDTDFSYKIRQLIDQVSTNLEIEFGKDDRLYGLLYAHLKTSDVLPTLFYEKQNEFVKKIETDNEKIFTTVKKVLTEVFSKRFPEMEFAFVTLHFVATLERSDLVLPLRAALISSYGQISCEFLMSSLRKNFPFLRRIDLIQSSTKFDKNQYDVFLTTEKDLDYIYVSRTLEQKNLDDIRRKLRMIQQSTRKSAIYSEDSPNNFISLNQLFSTGNLLLNEFEISKISNLPTITDVIHQIVQEIEVKNPKAIENVLEERFRETHLAIPETKIALLHGVHSSIKLPLFKIFDLNQKVDVIGMNREPLKVSRILLLLAPEEVPEHVAYLLGKISSSIIENKLYTAIYDSGNYDIVSKLLQQIITESITKYGE